MLIVTCSYSEQHPGKKVPPMTVCEGGMPGSSVLRGKHMAEVAIMVRLRTTDDVAAFNAVKHSLEATSIKVAASEVLLSALREQAKRLEAGTHD